MFSNELYQGISSVAEERIIKASSMYVGLLLKIHLSQSVPWEVAA